MSSEGKITADVKCNVLCSGGYKLKKNLMLSPKTFGDALVNMKNNFEKEFIPISQKLNTFANSGYHDFYKRSYKKYGCVWEMLLRQNS